MTPNGAILFLLAFIALALAAPGVRGLAVLAMLARSWMRRRG